MGSTQERTIGESLNAQQIRVTVREKRRCFERHCAHGPRVLKRLPPFQRRETKTSFGSSSPFLPLFFCFWVVFSRTQFIHKEEEEEGTVRLSLVVEEEGREKENKG